MKLLLFTLALLLTLLPVGAQGTSATKQGKPFELNASRSRLFVDPQWAVSDEDDKLLPDKLKPLIPGHTSEDGQIQETATTRIHIEENHGEVAVGVLGAYTEGSDGTITKIMPGCDLIRLGIRLGDKIKKINGVVYTDPIAFRDACRGLPGSTMIVTVERQGMTKPYVVKRTDARLYANDEDNYYKWCIDQIKRW